VLWRVGEPDQMAGHMGEASLGYGSSARAAKSGGGRASCGAGGLNGGVQNKLTSRLSLFSNCIS
jgi:hypothetical protein